MVIGDMDHVYVCVVCRIWPGNARKHSDVGVSAASPAGVRAEQLAWLRYRSGREFPLRRLCGARLRTHQQFSASQVGEAITMGKKAKQQESSGHAPSDSKSNYKDSLRKLQVELVKLQRHFIKCDDKILIILEGRDASGKDGTIKHWKAYSLARNEMLARTHDPTAPWTLVRANDKRLARLNIIKDLLSRLHYADKDKRLIRPDPQIVFAFDVSNLENGQLAK